MLIRNHFISTHVNGFPSFTPQDSFHAEDLLICSCAASMLIICLAISISAIFVVRNESISAEMVEHVQSNFDPKSKSDLLTLPAKPKLSADARVEWYFPEIKLKPS